MNSALTPISTADLNIATGDPRILDARIGERLGFKRPRAIRQIIERNRTELETDGSLAPQRVAQPRANGATHEVDEFYLNEGQALIICMFSRTPSAAAIRKEVIEVYMAYRRNGIGPTQINSWEKMTRHQAIVRQAVSFHNESKESEFAEAVTHLLKAGDPHRRLPHFWGDIEVRRAVINMHRQMTIDDANGALSEHFGAHRAPSRSAIGRIWKQLDSVRGGPR